MKPEEGCTYEFGPYRLNASEGLLLRQGQAIPLTPKVLETLHVLLRHAGHLLEKEVLMQAIWPDTFVEEGNLKANISTLRRVLGDLSAGQEYIETVPRRGYRFVAPVRVVTGNGVPFVQTTVTELTLEKRTRAETVTEEEIIDVPELALPATPVLPAAGTSAARVGVWWRAAAIGAFALSLMLILAILAIRMPKAARGAVVRVTYTGGRLQAWDEANQLAWSHQFPEPIEEPRTTNHSLLFADLSGDGSRNMVVVTALQQAGGTFPPNNSVSCFSPRGDLLWSYQPQMSLSFGGREFKGPWVVRDILASPDPQHRGLWVAYSHHTWWPSFLVRINAQGLAQMRFVNSGPITVLDTVTTAQDSFVLAGALNHEYDGAAALAILRDDQPFAASPQSPGTPFWCDQCTEDRPFRYYLFPRSELNRLEGQSHNPILSISSSVGQIRAVTNELPLTTAARYNGVYALNLSFDLIEAGFTDSYWAWHDRLQREGRLDHSVRDCPERKRIAVRLWDPEKGWREPTSEVAGSM